jgi:predicted amidohydrolase
MIKPYMAVGLQTTVHHVTTRDETKKNLDHICGMIDLVMHMCSMELPVKLIALSEGVIQGFVDEILHLSPEEYAETMAAEIPGWETEILGQKAKQHGIHIISQLKTIQPDFPDRFFNTVFIINPDGKVIHQFQKNIVLFVEHSTTPHDVYDQWVAKYGDGLDAFFPVAKTEIGNIAGSVGVEGAFPETFRAFALGGAEILYRGALPEPWTSRGIFEVQNRARAMDNTCYMIATNGGSMIMPGPDGTPPTTIDGTLGGRSAIYDYKGAVLAQNSIMGDSYVAAEINIEALRNYRETARFQNWIPYIKTELYQKLYDRSLWPKNKPNVDDKIAEELFRESLNALYKSGAYTKSKL